MMNEKQKQEQDKEVSYWGYIDSRRTTSREFFHNLGLTNNLGNKITSLGYDIWMKDRLGLFIEDRTRHIALTTDDIYGPVPQDMWKEEETKEEVDFTNDRELIL